MEAAVTFCWPESQAMWAYDRECTSGSGWIGTSRIPLVHCLCPFAATLVLELPSSFGCTFEEGGAMNRKYLALLVLFGSLAVPLTLAQITHIEMRVEGMT